MSAAVRVRLQNTFAKLKEIIWINEQQRVVAREKKITGPSVSWIHTTLLASKKRNQTFCRPMHRTILLLAAIVCMCLCVFFCFSVLLSTLCRSVATAYHFPWSWFAWNRLFFHFHSNCKCCSILKNGQFYLDILCMLRMLRTRSLIRWMMAHLRLQLYCALRTLYFYD